MPLRSCGAPGSPHRRSLPVPLPHLRTRRHTSARAPSAAPGTTRSPAGWTTRAPKRLTKPTRFSRPNASLRSRRRFCGGSKRSNVPGGSSPSRRFRHSGTSVRRGPQRWIAAAAVAGLIVGVGAGELLDFRRSMSRGPAAGHLGSQPTPARPERPWHAPAGGAQLGRLLSLRRFRRGEHVAACRGAAGARRADTARARPGSGQVGSWHLPSL